MKHSEQGNLVKDMRNEIKKILSSFRKIKTKEEKFKLRGGWKRKILPSKKFLNWKNPGMLKDLRKETQSREDRALKEVLGASQVILATNIGAADRVLKVRNQIAKKKKKKFLQGLCI